MNYRHAFHAGNHADVFKHVVLARIIEHLKHKAHAFRVIDLHAGAGLYDLTGALAERTGEWRDGVGRLYVKGTCQPHPLSEAAESLIAPWRKSIAAVNDGARLAHYPGSPELIRRLAREQDRFVFNELHADDHAALVERFKRERRATILQTDGWTGARALTPPVERRGLVVMDPPYEAANETSQALSALAEAHRRFATGVFMLWYPVKAQADANALARRAAALELPKSVRVELTVRRADRRDRLNGSGLIVVNPPWRLEKELQTLLPAMATRLADPAADYGGGWRFDRLTGELKTTPGQK